MILAAQMSASLSVAILLLAAATILILMSRVKAIMKWGHEHVIQHISMMAWVALALLGISAALTSLAAMIFTIEALK